MQLIQGSIAAESTHRRLHFYRREIQGCVGDVIQQIREGDSVCRATHAANGIFNGPDMCGAHCGIQPAARASMGTAL